MNKTNELYEALFKDLKANNYKIDSNLYRKFVCKCGEGVVYSVSVKERNRGLAIPIGVENKKIKFPEWKGVEISFVTLPEYSDDDQLYIQLKQMPGMESYIYEIVVEDIRKALSNVNHASDFAQVTHSILKKWKDFFSLGKKPVLSESSAQGLYGELLFLKELIEELGTPVVNSWAGINNETHDFYIGQNAVEVKTTATQAPYMAHINSEYQLDDHDVNGRLFLRMYALRKDSNGGQKLPELIRSIRKLFVADTSIMEVFNDKLIKAGYFDVTESYYTTGYSKRETYSFEIKKGFPRVIRVELPNGIYDLEYNVSIAQCMDFAIEAKELIKALKR